MTDAWLQFAGTLLGALVGGGIAMGTQSLLSAQQGRRERWRIATESAVQYHAQLLELAKYATSRNPEKPVSVMPLNVMMLAQLRFLEALERGPITAEELLKMNQEVDALDRQLREAGAVRNL